MNTIEFKQVMSDFNKINTAGLAIPFVGLTTTDDFENTVSIVIDGLTFENESQIAGWIALNDALGNDIDLIDGRLPVSVVLAGEYNKDDMEKLIGRYVKVITEYKKFSDDYNMDENSYVENNVLEDSVEYEVHDMSLSQDIFTDNINKTDIQYSLNDIYNFKEFNGFKALENNSELLLNSIISDYDNGQDSLEYFQECIIESIKRVEEARFVLKRRLKEDIKDYVDKKEHLLMNNIRFDKDENIDTKIFLVAKELVLCKYKLNEESCEIIDERVNKILNAFRQRMDVLETLLEETDNEDRD